MAKSAGCNSAECTAEECGEKFHVSSHDPRKWSHGNETNCWVAESSAKVGVPDSTGENCYSSAEVADGTTKSAESDLWWNSDG